LLLGNLSAAFAQASGWTGGIFLDLGGQYYLIPGLAGTLSPDMAERYDISEGLIKPWPGFRAGVGYEWRKFRFSLESGYTYIEGTNPLVLHIRLIPFLFKTGYAFSFGSHFTLSPVLGAGALFSRVDHYESAINMLLEKSSLSANTGFLFHGGFRAGWSFTEALALYAGVGMDCVTETGGLIPLPSIELGLTIKPFLFRKKPPPARPPDLPPARPPEQTPAEAETTYDEPEPAEIEIEAAAELEQTGEPEPVIPAKEPEAPAPVRVIRTLYFPPDAALPVRSHLVELDAAGELLRSSPELAVSLRGYTAPYGTVAGQIGLSEERARFCAGYLEREWGIETERIDIAWYGADRLPETGNGEEWRRRCVEIVIENRRELTTDLTDRTDNRE
jgi:outer membrane protein OmpA-like peptidoglycan-associated protein